MTTHSEYIDIIKNNVLFAGIDADILPNIAEKLEKLTVKKDTLIFKQHDESKGLYLVISGNVQIFTHNNEKMYVLSHAFSNHVFGEFLLLGNAIRTTSAVVIEDSELFYLSITDFNYLLQFFPQQLETIANRITNRLCWNQITIALRLSPLFFNLSEEIVRALTKELKTDSVPAKTLLYQEGVNSTELCIVVDGRFQVTKMIDGETKIFDVVGRGETIGEIGVLCDTPRTADITATRDSIVARLTRASFEKILFLYPLEINQAFSKNFVRRLINKKGKAQGTETFTIALVVLSPSIAPQDIAESLSNALKNHGATSIVDSELIDRAFSRSGTAQTDFTHSGNNALLHWLAEWEIAHKNIIFVVDLELNNWTLRCLRQSDHIVFVADATDSPAVGEFESQILNEIDSTHKKQTLLLMHSSAQKVPTGTSHWLNARNVSMHHHIRYKNKNDFGRVARFLTGKAVGLVLGGGGARGFAHVGVLRALEELKIPIDIIGGNSMGALIAAQSALQWNRKDMIERTVQLCLAGDNITLPIISLFSGNKMMRGLYAMFGEVQIDDLWNNFYTISCNISRATLVTHDSGSLLAAVLNSNTPPGLFPPQVISNGDLLVDGALLNNLPVDVMRKYNEGGIVIAVDINSHEDLLNNTKNSNEMGGISGWKVFFDKLNPFSAPKIKMPSMIETLSRASIIGGLAQRKKMMDGYADLYLQPPVNNFSLGDHKHGEQIAEIGYKYALEEFQKWINADGLSMIKTVEQ